MQIRKWYEFYNQRITIWQQAVAKLGEDTVYPDLLFYHLELRCYVVVELKITKFKAEHLGQLGVYVSAVNHIKKKGRTCKFRG